MRELSSRAGFEVELLAPAGSDRRILAQAIATAHHGAVSTIFHRDSEVSAVPGMKAFRHLSLGFQVTNADGRAVCTVVDDITINAELDTSAPPAPGWYRIVTDEPRLLNLMQSVCDPDDSVDHVLEPVASLFATEVQCSAGVARVHDRDRASVALAAPLPGQRHRPSEIVSPPIDADHEQVLQRLLGPAQELGFSVPLEAAVHVHVDSTPYRDSRVLADVIELFFAWHEPLRFLLGTNPNCHRLSPPGPRLVALVPQLRAGCNWKEACQLLREAKLTKYSDVNLLNVVTAPPHKDTLEVRILAGADNAATIMDGALLVEGLLRRCRDGSGFPAPSGSLPDDAQRLRKLAGPS